MNFQRIISCAAAVLCIVAVDARAQTGTPRCDSVATANITDTLVDRITGMVAGLPKVKAQIAFVDRRSHHRRHISLIPFLEDSVKNIYVVKVAEDNGSNYVTYFNILVDANTMTILPADRTRKNTSKRAVRR